MKYRKKPVVIDVFRFGDVPPDWAIEAARAGILQGIWRNDGADIQTLEGVMSVKRGDWIIRGVKGEIYSCKPDIFAMTYEEVT